MELITDADDEDELNNVSLGDVQVAEKNFEDMTIEVSTKKIDVSDFLVGPDTIFMGKVGMLDANFFQANQVGGEALSGLSITWTIKKAIAQLYVLLRNLCAAIMLGGLIFVGIRILLTSNHPEKQAQWKSILTDWLIGLVLLIFSHILMIGIFYISDTLTFILGKEMFGMGSLNASLIWRCLDSWESAEQIICLIMLGYLIYLTVIYAIAYFKRLLWVALLIIFAPVMAVMYSFGRATKQIYSNWMKEYMMTVLIQPYHMLIYSVLISLPLNMATSDTTGGFGGPSSFIGNTFALIYALGAMSFIKPAEKYMRDLFGFSSSKAASHASYESGKKTIDAAIKTVTTIGAAVATGGASMATTALGAMEKSGGGSESSGLTKTATAVAATIATGGAAAPVAAEAAAEGAVAAIGETGGVEALANGITDTGINEAAPKDPVLDQYRSEGFGQNAFGEYFNPWTDEYDSSYDPHNDETYNEDLKNKTTDEQQAKGEDQQEQVEDNQENNSSPSHRNNSTTSSPENVVADEIGDSVSSAMMELKNEGNNAAGTINANNVIINASNIVTNTSGKNPAGENAESSTKGDETPPSDSSKAPKDTSKADKEPENNDGEVDILNEGKEKTKRRFPGAMSRDFLGMATGQQSVVETLGDSRIGRKIHSKAATWKAAEGDGLGSKLKRSIGGKVEKGTNLMKGLEQTGGIEKIHAALNGLRDSFFDTDTSSDWKPTNERLSERTKESQEQSKYEMVNRQDKEWLINDFEVKLRSEHPDKTKYPDKLIRSMAEDKAKEKAKSLADTYVPLGVTDISLAYKCDQDRKEYGLTAKQAVAHRVSYENFISDSKNIEFINNRYPQDDGKPNNFTNVEDAIGPKTRDYFNEGYNQIGNMALVRELTNTLNVSMQRGIQLDQVLRRKGGDIDYSKIEAKLSKEQKDTLKKIMDEYKK